MEEPKGWTWCLSILYLYIIVCYHCHYYEIKVIAVIRMIIIIDLFSVELLSVWIAIYDKYDGDDDDDDDDDDGVSIVDGNPFSLLES